MRRIHGFTLIELMVVVAIIAILAVLVMPSFINQIRKSHRSEAMRGLSELQFRQEKWRASHAKYVGTDSTAAEKTALGIPISDYYDFALDAAAAGTTFRVKATAKGAQVNDTNCALMKLEVSGTTVSKTPTTNRCWN